jgi:hypothetical protein
MSALIHVPPPATKALQKAEHGRVRAIRQLERQIDNEVWNAAPRQTNVTQDARHPRLVTESKRPRRKPDIDMRKTFLATLKTVSLRAMRNIDALPPRPHALAAYQISI